MADTKYTKALYDQLNTKLELGDFAQFETMLSTDDKFRKAIYDQASTELDLGDYPTFEGTVKKKVSPLDLASTGQTVLQELGQPLNESITPKLPSEPKKETNWGLDLLRSISSSSKRALGGIAETPTLITRTVQGLTMKPLMKAMGATDEEAEQSLEYINSLNTFGQAMQLGETAQKALNKSAMKTEAKMKAIEGNIVSNIREGDWGEAGELLGRGIAQSLPYLAMTIGTAGGGTPAVLTTIGATSAAQQYGELEGKPEPQRKLNAWLYGGFEAAGELVTAGLLRGVGKSFRQGMAKTVNPEMVKGMAKGIAKDFGINILEEGGSEMATQIGQNITDIITGVDPNRNVFDNVLDAGLIGGVSGGAIGGAKVGASALGRAMASPKEVQEVENKVSEQGVLIDQIESTDSDPVKKALESRLKTLSYEANKIMDKNYELAKTLSPEQHSKVAELFSTWNELQAKIDNKEIVEENAVKAVENAIEGIKDEIEGIKEAKIAELGEIKEEGVKFKIGKETFEDKESVEGWLDKNYLGKDLPPLWHKPTETLVDNWVKANKETIMRKGLEAETKQAEENQRKRVEGLENAEYKGIVDYGEGARDSYDVTSPTGVVTNMLLPHMQSKEQVQKAVNEKRESFLPKEKTVFNKQDVVESLIEQLPEESKEIMRTELTAMAQDEFIKYAKQAGFNNIGSHWTLGTVSTTKSDGVNTEETDQSSLTGEATVQAKKQETVDRFAEKTEEVEQPVQDNIRVNYLTDEQATRIGEKLGFSKEQILADSPANLDAVYDPSLKDYPIIKAIKEELDKKQPDTSTEIGFTQNKSKVKGYKELKAKLGEKKFIKYFQQVDNLFNPNKNTIVEYRENGVIIKEEDKYIFHALGDTDMKKWRDAWQQDVTDQFAPKSSLQEQPTITETESEKDNNSTGDVPNGDGTWRDAYNKSNDIAEKQVILETIADSSTSTEKELTDVYDAGKGIETETNRINWALVNNKNTPQNIFDEIINTGVLKKTTSDDAINVIINKRKSFLEAKQATTATTDEKTTEVPPKPPKSVVDDVAELTDDRKTRAIGAKVIDSANVRQEVKDALLEHGIDYIPRGQKITKTEAQEIVNAFATNEDGLDKLAQAVYDIKNDIAGDTRVTLNVYIAEKYSKLLDEATDPKVREKYRNKVAEAFIFGQEFATSAGQTVEAMKRWRELLSRDPESIIAIKKRQQRKANDFVLEGLEPDIKSAKEVLDSIVNTDEFKQFIETEVNKEIDKIANKKYGEVDKKKINDFFDSLIIKNDKAFDATIGIPIAVYNGAMLTIKKAVLAGVDIANAIKQAVDYIDAWYKENYAKGTTPSPEWNRDDYVAQMNTLLKPLTKKVKKVKMKVSKEVEESLVDKIYAKMSNATKPQLRRLVRDYITTLESEGAISEQRFKDLFAKAIGLDVLTAEDEQKIRETAQSLKNSTKTAEKLVAKFKELVDETDNAKIKQLEEEVKTLKKDANKAKFEALKASRKLAGLMTEKATLGSTIHTLIQGNLLTPISLISNVVGNTMFLPVRNVAYMVSSGLDLMISKLASVYTPLLGDPWVKANPRLRRLIESLPTPSREYDYFASTRGYWYGVPEGLQEGIRQMWTGTLPEDEYQKYVSQGLNPWKAALRARDQMTGKEQMALDTFLANLLEAFPTTYMAEGFFRTLNLGDKPYRRAAERSRLEELASLKGLKGNQREAFINNPDPDSVEEARKTGDVAVYQQDTIVSEMFSWLNRRINRVAAERGTKRTSVIVSTVAALFKATQAPYVKTPVNLIGEAIDYSIPSLSLFRALYYAKSGNKRKSYEYFGKAVTGYMLMNVAFFLIKEGLLSPPTDDDEKIRQAQYDAKPGYSLNLDATWRKVSGGSSEWKDKDQVVNIQRLGVFSMILMGMSKAYADMPPDEMQKEMSFIDKSSTSLKMIPAEIGASLEQSFLSGTASGIKAFTEGGPAFDKWVISTSKALSAVVYPNTIAQISQVFFDDNYIREVKDMYSRDEKFKKQIVNTFKDRTFMGKDLPAKVTLWGEKVKRVPEGESWAHVMFDVTKSVEFQKSSFGVRMFEFYERYKFLDETEAKKILPSIPSATNTVGWDERNMTATEVEQFQMLVGQRRKSYVENMMNSEEWGLMSDEDKIVELEKVYRKTASKVKAGMFLLDVIKADKKVFNFLEENDMIPVPTRAVTITHQREKVKLNPEDTFSYYQNVQRYFVERLNNSNLLEEKAEKDTKSQERLLDRINGHWNKSKDMAQRDWITERNKQ